MGFLSKDMIGDLIINIVNILVLFFVVKALLYKPVKKYLEARKEKIASVLTQADESAKQAAQLKGDYEKLLADSADVKMQAAADGEKAAKEHADKIIDAANAQAQTIIAEAREKALSEHDKLLENARGELTDIAVEISSKLLGRTVTDADNRSIVESFFSE